MRGSLFQIITFIGLTVSQDEKAVRKGIPYNHVNLTPFDSIEAIGVYTPIDNSDVLLAAVYKSPGLA
jgi:hypothetical protein